MQCAVIGNGGKLTITTDPLTSCPGFVVLESADLPALGGFQVVTVTAPDVAYVLSWGFGVVLFFWSLGYAIGAAKRAIKLL